MPLPIAAVAVFVKFGVGLAVRYYGRLAIGRLGGWEYSLLGRSLILENAVRKTTVSASVSFLSNLNIHDAHGDKPGDNLPTDNASLQGSPLILDLDGDGVEAGGVALFDHEGDGFAELSRWVGGDDGLLVWDRNGDGVISSGRELFGNNTVLSNNNWAENGFEALAELDSNDDGVVDANDDNFGALQILRWTDTDDDGEKDAMELVSRADVGVQSLNTAFVNSDYVDKYGNEYRQVGSYVKSDGTTATMTDVWFYSNRRVSVYDGSVIPAHSEAVSGLPDLLGSGLVYDLRDAMALDDAGRLSAPFYDGERSETPTLQELVAALGGARGGASCPFLWTGEGKKAGKAGAGLTSAESGCKIARLFGSKTVRRQRLRPESSRVRRAGRMSIVLACCWNRAEQSRPGAPPEWAWKAVR